MAIGQMHELDPSGDTKIVWDSDNPEEVENARATFDRLTSAHPGPGKRRYVAFHVKKNGEQGGRMERFDPDAEKIILVPQIAGG